MFRLDDRMFPVVPCAVDLLSGLEYMIGADLHVLLEAVSSIVTHYLRGRRLDHVSLDSGRGHAQ